MAWYKVALSANDILADRLSVIQQDFGHIHIQAGSPDDAALFDTNDAGPGCILYFSPGASRIAMQLILNSQGLETSAPRRSEVGLLVGKESAWERVPFAGDKAAT